MKTYKKGRPSKRKVSKNGPSKKNKLRKKNKTKKMKKIKGGSFLSEKCIPVFMESGNVKRAMQNILCGLKMSMTGVSSKSYGENNYVQMNKPIDGNHIEINSETVTKDSKQYTTKNITITDMLYRDELIDVIPNQQGTTLHRNNNTGMEIRVSTNFIPYTKAQAAKINNQHAKINAILNSIPTGKKTDNKTTYTRDDDPISFHNTPIFYYINDHTDLEFQIDGFRIEQLQTYETALERLRTNSVCQSLLSGTNMNDYTFTYKLRNDYKYSDEYINQVKNCVHEYKQFYYEHGERNKNYEHITVERLIKHLKKNPNANNGLPCVRAFKKHYGITGLQNNKKNN